MPVQRKLDKTRLLNDLLCVEWDVKLYSLTHCVPVQYEEECECKSEPDSTFASVPESISNSTSASSPAGGSQTSSCQEQSSSKMPALYCQSPVRVVERGGCRRREAEFGDVIRLTVTYGCMASLGRCSGLVATVLREHVDVGSVRSVEPCSAQGANGLDAGRLSKITLGILELSQ